MRLVVSCEVDRPTLVPINHQHLLTAVAYQFLARGDDEYARFLHEEDYRLDDGPKRFKLFCFSGLRAGRRRIAGDTLWLGPGRVQWIIGSPVDAFLQNFASGLLASGVLTVGSQRLPIAQAQGLPSPDFAAGTASFTCLTPIVAGVAGEQGGTRYLRPCEGEAFSAAVRGNLLHKYRALHGHAPEGEDAAFSLAFDADYLARSPHGGTKLVEFKNIFIRGGEAPFTACGSPALLQLLHDCGAGEKNSGGFGMVEAQKR